MLTRTNSFDTYRFTLNLLYYGDNYIRQKLSMHNVSVTLFIMGTNQYNIHNVTTKFRTLEEFDERSTRHGQVL